MLNFSVRSIGMALLALALLVGPGLQGSNIAQAVVTPFPLWSSYLVTAIGNGVNGCANANGCWSINGALGPNKAAALTQNIVLFGLPANGFVQSYRIKSAVQCTGTASLASGLGTASSPNFYLISATGYDLEAAVSATNITTALPLLTGADTSAAVNVVASLTSTGQNIDQVTAGCSFTVSVLSGLLP
jgi:hypothetical protein